MRRLSIAFFGLGMLAACSSSSDDTTPSTVTPGAGIDAGTQQDAGNTDPATCATSPCADGTACTAPTDCSSGYCVSDVCVPKGCADGVLDNDETDVDCGGSCILGCAPTKTCAVDTDCLDKVCSATKICKPPTSGDGLKNGNESDTDCGSSTAGRFDTKAARCDAGKVCAGDVDCKSGGCNMDTKTCAFARSCATTNGGTTCGAGDSTSATKNHEDCCTSAEVPVYTGTNNFANATKFRLDKYTITAGRMRKFLDAVKGNVKGWVQANRANLVAPNQLPDTLDKYLPAAWIQPDSTDMCQGDTGGDMYPCNYGALAQMSGYRYNNEPGGNGGYACDMFKGAYGARTFRLTDKELADFGDGESQHVVPEDRLAQKALECTNYYMLASFCAWDGGRLETLGEYDAAYGGDGGYGGQPAKGYLYPWQSSDQSTRALGFYDSANSNIYPNYNFNPPDWPGAKYQCSGADCLTVVTDPVTGDTGPMIGLNTTRYSAYSETLSRTDASAILLRLRRANAFYNYGNYIITDFFQSLGATEKSVVAAEQIDQADDQSVIVAPPGRYTSGYGKYGHADLLGNVIEITATPYVGGVPTQGATISPTSRMTWARNGSYEISHFNTQTMTGSIFEKAMLTKYARAGGRCARPTTIYPATVLPAAP